MTLLMEGMVVIGSDHLRNPLSQQLIFLLNGFRLGLVVQDHPLPKLRHLKVIRQFPQTFGGNLDTLWRNSANNVQQTNLLLILQRLILNGLGRTHFNTELQLSLNDLPTTFRRELGDVRPEFLWQLFLPKNLLNLGAGIEFPDDRSHLASHGLGKLLNDIDLLAPHRASPSRSKASLGGTALIPTRQGRQKETRSEE